MLKVSFTNWKYKVGTTSRRKERKTRKNKKVGNNKKDNTRLQKDIAIGESFARILTGVWGSQSSPGKVYVRGYRIHHGAIGFVGALACACLNKPTAFGFFKHLVDDDRDDWGEWFSGEKLQRKSTTTTKDQTEPEARSSA